MPDPSPNLGPRPPLAAGDCLGDRYEVLAILGQGGFGRTYLAVDRQRFQERCVLKEFAPQVRSAENQRKAKDLFEREAGVLYRLRHPQVPQFRELRSFEHRGFSYLLLVQEYVAGKTYREWLEERQQTGRTFQEQEVTTLLRQVLPVLTYLHREGVIHRDISPENLICRQSDGLPVLIDFGAVKHAAVTVVTSLGGQVAQRTRLGKAGYSPPEQMQQGRAYPHSDLYALAATLLTLLTGQEPQALMNPFSLDWIWPEVVQVEPHLAAVLTRMLALRPSDRLSTAQAALDLLEGKGGTRNAERGTLEVDGPLADAPPVLEKVETRVERPAVRASQPESRIGPPPPSPLPPPLPSRSQGWGTLAIALALSLGGLALAWMVVQGPGWRQALPTATPSLGALAAYPQEEAARSQVLEEKRQALGLTESVYLQVVNQAFYEKHPELQGRSLTMDAADAILRWEWDELAAQWLARLEKLSPAEREQLLRSPVAEQVQWLQELDR